MVHVGVTLSLARLFFTPCPCPLPRPQWIDFGAPDSPPSPALNFTGDSPDEYTTSLIGNSTLRWIRSVVETGQGHRPFFAWVGPHAPHLPSTPAKW
jgi:hypothetical protein